MQLIRAFGILFATASLLAAVTEKRPNIIVILVDDMGFSDIGSYGSEIPTPNLDALAAGGLRFSQFYNTGRCCPTRASLLTGLYSHQAGIGHMNADQKLPGYRGFLTENTATIAELLAPAGYFTAMCGKWHVGHDAGVTPASRGFRRSLHLPAGGVYFPGSTRCDLHLDGQPIAPDDKQLPAAWYGTDLWTDFSIRFIDDALTEKKPFFLYLAHVAPHFPLQAEAGDIARFRGKYKEGWDALSAKRLSRQRESRLIQADIQAAPRPAAIAAWDSLDESSKDRFDHIMAVYAACVWRMDQSIGTLVSALKERSILDDTVIVFMSDNGGNAESGPRGRNQGDPTKASSDWFCGESWAYLQNTPFRKSKRYNHEGGIASPLIIHWPAGIKESRWVSDPSHLIDILPTCLDLAGAGYPSTLRDKPITPAEGTSLRPLFSGGALPERSLFWEHEGNAAIRRGSLKLVREGNKSPWELYDLAKDRTELNNLSQAQPETASSMADSWEAWATRAQVKPRPGKAGRAGKKAKTQ